MGIKFKQESIFHEWNKEKDGLDILVILETEDKQFHQMVKFIPKSYIEKFLAR